MNKSNLHPDRNPLDAMLIAMIHIDNWESSVNCNFAYHQSDSSQRSDTESYLEITKLLMLNTRPVQLVDDIKLFPIMELIGKS
jgi:hypothetical protein